MSQKPKSKKKHSHLVRNAFVMVFLVLVAVILIDALNQSNQGSTQTSTPSASSQLLPSDFYIVPTKGDCGFITSSSLKAFILSAELHNNRDLPFHFVVAQISIVNYTLANGTVIVSNEQQSDNITSYGTTHSFDNIEVYTTLPKTSPKIATIDFVATVYVQEVSGPITIPFSLPNANC